MEPDYYGIKIKNVNTQNFEMYPVLFVTRKECEATVEALSRVTRPSLCPIMVEIWDPDRATVLKDSGNPGLKMQGAEEIGKALDKDPAKDWIDNQGKLKPDFEGHSIEWWYRHHPWLVPYVFPGLSRNRMYVSTPDPTEVTPWFGILDPITGEPLGPRYKCEAGDGSEYPCEAGDYVDKYPCSISSFATC